MSLDLCSTVLWRHLAPVEQLNEPADLARWLREAGVEPVLTAPRSEHLDAARDLRECIYSLAHDQIAGRPLGAAPLATLNALAAHPDPAPAMLPDGRVEWAADAPADAALARVARDAIDLLAGSSAARLRECSAPDCAFLFVDTSRPGRRRWCASNRCGNRQHAREHRRRQRSDVAPDPTSPTRPAPPPSTDAP